MKNVGDSEELQYKNRRKMSTLNQNTAECEAVVRRLLELNLKVTSMMAFLNSNGDVHIGDNSCHINLSQAGNSFQLLHPEIVSQFTDLDDERKHAICQAALTNGLKLESNIVLPEAL